jgi:hypothetical protein
MDRIELERLSKEELIGILLQLLPKIEHFEEKIKVLEAAQKNLINKLRKYNNENTPSSSIPYYEKDDENHRHRQSGQKEGHKGMSRKKPDKIDRVEFLPVKISPCCHAPVRKLRAKPKERVVSHLIPPKIENVKYLKERGICTNCGEEVQAEVPNTLPNCRFDLYFMVLLSVLSVGMNLPFGKIRSLLKFLWSLDVSEGAISNNLAKLGTFLGNDYEKLKQDIRKESVKYDDETGWRILGKGYWLWDFIGSKTAFYTIEPSRGKKVVRKILGKKSAGVNVTDGLPSYDEHESRKQKCWAHLLRRFKQVVFFPFKNKREKEDYRKLKNSLKLVFKRAKAEKEKFGASVKLREKYENKLGRILAKKYRGMNTEKIITTARNQQFELFTFLEFEGVEPTNNRAERGLKAPIIKRKISYQNRSIGHARNYVMQLSILKTAELRGQNYPDVLKDIIHEQSAAGKF